MFSLRSLDTYETTAPFQVQNGPFSSRIFASFSCATGRFQHKSLRTSLEHTAQWLNAASHHCASGPSLHRESLSRPSHHVNYDVRILYEHSAFFPDGHLRRSTEAGLGTAASSGSRQGHFQPQEIGLIKSADRQADRPWRVYASSSASRSPSPGRGSHFGSPAKSQHERVGPPRQS